MHRQILLPALVVSLLFLAACGDLEQAGTSQSSTPPSVNTEAAIREAASGEVPGKDCYLQLAAYIQEGMRTYGLDQELTLRFAPWSAGEGGYTADVAVELADGGRSTAEYTVSYDGETYTFTSVREAFLRDAASSPWADGQEENLAAPAAVLTLSRDTPLGVAPRYTPVPGPTSGTAQYDFGLGSAPARCSDYYIDRRMGFQAFVDYPSIYDGADATVPDLVREAAYGAWTPEEFASCAGGDVEIDYRITRNDENYLSIVFIEWSYFQGSAHPAWYERAITIDRAEKGVLSLSDVLQYTNGEELAALISSGAFPEPGGFDTPPVSDLAKEFAKVDESGYLNHFYLTEDSLCLIVPFSRYYTILTAPCSSLPMKLK